MPLPHPTRRESFQHFIGQDAAFLLSFAETYSAALDLCSPEQSHLAAEVKKMLRGARDELRLHESYAKKWGLLLEHQRPAPATKAYIYFLQMVSRQNDTVRARGGGLFSGRCTLVITREWRKAPKHALLVSDPSPHPHPQTLADIMSAVLPCLRLYRWLGRQLSKLQTSTDNPYAGGWSIAIWQYTKGRGRPHQGLESGAQKGARLQTLQTPISFQSGLRRITRSRTPRCRQLPRPFWKRLGTPALTVRSFVRGSLGS